MRTGSVCVMTGMPPVDGKYRGGDDQDVTSFVAGDLFGHLMITSVFTCQFNVSAGGR